MQRRPGLDSGQYSKTCPRVPSASCVLQHPTPMRNTIRIDAQPKDLLLCFRHTRNTTSTCLLQDVLASCWHGCNLARTKGHCDGTACRFPRNFLFLRRDTTNPARVAQDDTANAKMVSSPWRIQSCCASRLRLRMGKNPIGSGFGRIRICSAPDLNGQESTRHEHRGL